MSTGTNAPSVAELNKWFDDILRFPKQVELLDLEQLDFLKEHLRQKNIFHRDFLVKGLSKERKLEIEQIKNKVYREEIKEIKQEKQSGYEKDVLMFEKLMSKDIDWWLDEYVDKLDVLLAIEIVCHDDFNILCEFCLTDEEVLMVLELINDRLYSLEVNNNIHPKKDCSTYFKNNLSVFIYASIRFLSDELDLRLSTYKTSKEAGEVIGRIIYDSISYSSNWSLRNIQRYSSSLYNAIIKGKRVINWSNIQGKDDFNRRFEKVIALTKEEISEIERCITNYKEI
jgi:hypothetical protein